MCERIDKIDTALQVREQKIQTLLDNPEIGQHLIERHVSRNHYLFRQNAPFSGLFIVKSGAFKLAKTTADGREQITTFYYPTELIGYDAIHSQQHHATLTALEESRVYEIRYANFVAVQQSSPAFQQYINEILSQHLHHEYNLANNAQALEKLAAFIINFIDRNRAVTKDQFQLPMCRDDIGSLLGLTAETVTRSLTTLKENNVVSCSGKRLSIMQYKKLLSFASITP